MPKIAQKSAEIFRRPQLAAERSRQRRRQAQHEGVVGESLGVAGVVSEQRLLRSGRSGERDDDERGQGERQHGGESGVFHRSCSCVFGAPAPVRGEPAILVAGQASRHGLVRQTLVPIRLRFPGTFAQRF